MKNERMMGILKKTNQEAVWSDLITGFNQAINSIAPTKVVQCKKNHEPYINQEVLDFIEETNQQLTTAIRISDLGEWRKFNLKSPFF